MSEVRHAVVIGGGVVGAACAHYLLESGWRVTIVDRGQFGRGCSHANCGYVCPSHVLPLAVPGAVRGAMKAMFARTPPLRVRPALRRGWGRWLGKSPRRCNAPDMM